MAFLSLLQQFMDNLHAQHQEDMVLYRTAHQHPVNQALHRVLIPLEVTAFVWLLTTVIIVLRLDLHPRNVPDQPNRSTKSVDNFIATILIQTLVWTLGLLSWAVAGTETYRGLAILTFHVGLGRFCTTYVPRLKVGTSAIVGTVMWTVSWILQVVVGHYVVEGRPPNILTDAISTLSACTSVVLAWEV